MPKENVARNGVLVSIVGFVVALLAVWGAMVRPMQLQMDDLKKDIGSHALQKSHPGTLEESGSIKERFTEIETQFKNLDERTGRIESQTRAEFIALEKRIQGEIAALDRLLSERINNVKAEQERRRPAIEGIERKKP